MRRLGPAVLVVLLVTLLRTADAEATTFSCHNDGNHSATSGTFAISPVTGDCTAGGDIPSTLTVTVSGQTLLMPAGATNAGTIDSVGGLNTGLDDSGTLTNTGTIRDDSPDHGQLVQVATLVNRGSIVSVGGGGLNFGGDPSQDTVDNFGSMVSQGAGELTMTDVDLKLENGSSTSTPTPQQFTFSQSDTLDVIGGTLGGGTDPGMLNLIFEGSAGSSSGALRTTSSIAMTGTVPAAWTISLSGAGLSAAAGSQNAGTIDFVDDLNSGLVAAGTFTNTGLIRDDSAGHAQAVNADELVNSGTVDAKAGYLAFGAASGAAPSLDNAGAIKIEGSATSSINGERLKLEPGSTLATPSDGQLTVSGDTVDVAGGTFGPAKDTGGVSLAFEPSAGSASGSLTIGSSASLAGTLPAAWSLTLGGGELDAADGAGSAGTITFAPGNAAIHDPGMFTNTGAIVASTTSGEEVSGTPFVNAGSVTIGPDSQLSTNGSLQLAGSSVLGISVASATRFGAWVVTGPVSLGGTLNVSQDPAYAPATGDDLGIVRAGAAVSGAFAAANGLNGLSLAYPGSRADLVAGTPAVPIAGTTPTAPAMTFGLTRSLVTVRAPARKAKTLPVELKGLPAGTKLTLKLTLGHHTITARGTAGSAGTASLKITIAKKLRATLRSRKTKSVKLAVTATPPGASATTLSIALKLKK